jgi:hypothetical protein
LTVSPTAQTTPLVDSIKKQTNKKQQQNNKKQTKTN